MRNSIVPVLLVASLGFASCNAMVKDIQAISFTSGGASSEHFKASGIHKISGKTFYQKSIQQLSDEELRYINSLPDSEGVLGHSNNIIIHVSDGRSQKTRFVNWSRNNDMLNGILNKFASTLDDGS